MRIGILGGTFNPVHKAHLQMANCAIKKLGLNRVLLMVAADPPHKQVADAVEGRHRFRMAQLAAQDAPGVEASDLELGRRGKSYTCDTLSTLKKLYPDAELTLILGSDMLADLPNWKNPAEILSMARVACIPRKGCNETDGFAREALKREFGVEVAMLPACALLLSSTDIRRRVFCGFPVTGLVADAVERYIFEQALYFPEEIASRMERMRAELPAPRYAHVLGTMIEAGRLAEAWGADLEAARLAALLHDCAKYMQHDTQLLLSGEDLDVPPVLHAAAGAVLARTRYGVSSDAVLRAIRLHATGDANMTALDMALYLADITEPGRDFDGVEAIRAACGRGPEAGMLCALERVRAFVKAQGLPYHPASERALDYFTKRNKT